MASRTSKKSNHSDHGTYVRRYVMDTEAWRALSPKAQILYVWLRLEWKGAKFNNNGRIRLSYRQASYRIGIGVNAVMGAFHELQAKGFIRVTEKGCLGVEGEARGPKYELTEIGLPRGIPAALFLKWKEGHDFEVIRHRVDRSSCAA